VRYLRINIELYFTLPVSTNLRNRITQAGTALNNILLDGRKINLGQPNEENTIRASVTDENISGVDYRHVTAEIALQYPLSPTVQTKFDTLRTRIQNFIADAETPTGDILSPIKKIATYHICTHEPPCQACTGVTNL